MLLLDDNGNITHLNILLLGPAHVGKTCLRSAFLKGATFGSSKVRTRGPWQGVYDPTIEDSHTIQYILPATSNPGPTSPISPVESLSSNSTLSDDLLPDAQVITEEDLWQKRRGQRIILTISDVGGHPFYGTIWQSAIAAADAFMLVYDVGSRQSFDAMWGFYRQVVETKWARPADIPIIMLGNMVDNVTSDPQVTFHDKRLRQVTRDMGQSFADLLRIPFTETTVMAPQSVAHCFRQLITIAQKQASKVVAAGQAVRADSTAQLLPSFYRTIRRPSDASISGTGIKDASATIGRLSHTSNTLRRGSADRVYGATSRPHDVPSERSRDSASTGASTTSSSSKVAQASANSTNCTGAGMAGCTSLAPLKPLPPAPVDSIRFRRDAVFRAWKAFQRHTESTSAQLSDAPPSDVPRNNASGSRPSSPTNSYPAVVPARSESLFRISRRPSGSSSSVSSSSSKPPQDSGIYIPLDTASRKNSVVSTVPTMTTVASGYTFTFGHVRHPSGISVPESSIDVAELERQLERERSAQTAALATPMPVPAPMPSYDGKKMEYGVASRPSTPVPTPAPAPSSQPSSLNGTPKRLQRSQRDLQMLLDELEGFQFDDSDEHGMAQKRCTTGSGLARSKSASCLNDSAREEQMPASKGSMDLVRSILAELDEREVREIVEEFGLKRAGRRNSGAC